MTSVVDVLPKQSVGGSDHSSDIKILVSLFSTVEVVG